MKKTALLILILSILWGCSKAGTIQFCEGVTPKGEGVNCGKKFESGDITALITGGEPFGVKQITVEVVQKRDAKKGGVEKYSFTVSPDRQTATVNLPFYAAGTYSVSARKNNVAVGSGEVEIVDY